MKDKELHLEDVKDPQDPVKMSGMPNGGQTGDPCLRLTFPRTGLAGEDGVGRTIVLLQFRPDLNYGLQVYSRIYTLIITKYQYNTSPLQGRSVPHRRLLYCCLIGQSYDKDFG